MFSQRRGKNISSRGPPFSRSNPFTSFLGRMESRSKESYITVIRKSGQDNFPGQNKLIVRSAPKRETLYPAAMKPIFF